MQTIRQALMLLRQNPLLSTIFILGTAFAITMIMAIVITWQMKYADMEPEVNRSRCLYISKMHLHGKENKEWNTYSSCSPAFMKECVQPLPEVEACTAFVPAGVALVSMPDGTNSVKVDAMETDGRLDDRKVKILKAVIQNYLDTGEPVGSRTISKLTDLQLSSATIRNEMADLEELGYIVQPHTSAGRIPTDKGYRLYVDDLMAQKEEEISLREQQVGDKEKELDSMKDALSEKVDRVEELLQNVAKVLANNTNYATMITTPKVTGNKLRFVQLSQLEPNKLLAVIVMEGNLIRNKVITISEDISPENLLKLNLLLNTTLTGLTLQEMHLGLISKMESQAGEHMGIVKEVLDAIVETISKADDLKIYTSGATNIFKYPELSDSGKASELIYALEEKQGLSGLVNDKDDSDKTEDDNHGIQVYIGNETPVESMKDCSVVTATYELQDGMKGTIGIIGPKRMDYEKVVDTLKEMQTHLDDVFKKT